MILILEGVRKKNGKKCVFCQTPLGPPPGLVFFTRKKLTSNLFFQNEPLHYGAFPIKNWKLGT